MDHAAPANRIIGEAESAHILTMRKELEAAGWRCGRYGWALGPYAMGHYKAVTEAHAAMLADRAEVFGLRPATPEEAAKIRRDNGL